MILLKIFLWKLKYVVFQNYLIWFCDVTEGYWIISFLKYLLTKIEIFKENELVEVLLLVFLFKCTAV
jgi:hypothetical protein